MTDLNSRCRSEGQQFQELIDIAIALSAQTDVPALLESILQGAKNMTRADGGTIYVLNNDKLEFKVLVTDSLKIKMGGKNGAKISIPAIPLHYANGRPNYHTVVTSAVLDEQTVNIEDAYNDQRYDFSGSHQFDQHMSYRTQSMLTIPMRNHEREIIGVLQLINAQDFDLNVVPFSDQAQKMGEALASLAASALTKQGLIRDLENLFDSLIRLLATAIDEKSPHTGGHCKRVPELTLLLADKVSASDYGELADFSMSQNMRRELEVAAWLHDCGKITTPEYVVDKSTKLETIYDRINELEARLEILRRDAEIEFLKLQLNESSPEILAEGENVYQEKLAKYAEIREFIRRVNIGGEFMQGDDLTYLHKLCRLKFVDMDGTTRPLLSREEERYLSVSRGTLTAQEREIINHHIVATNKMLEALPFPKHLQNVPEYAGGHHERMDGTGYPKGLTREEMSVPARVMAIADIFEALSARDRPYKDGKKLSECLRIMGFMKKDNHIDPDLFHVFVEEKVYLDYAQRFLAPVQIDEVDHSQIPGYNGR